MSRFCAEAAPVAPTIAAAMSRANFADFFILSPHTWSRVRPVSG
jgi:hypothetical protein